MVLASARITHFGEQHVSKLVDDNLCNLLKHCSDSDIRVCADAHLVVCNYGQSGLSWVQKTSAATMQRLTEDLLSSAQISQAIVRRVYFACRHLSVVWRCLERPQRQVWVSLLVRIFSLSQFAVRHESVVDDLRLLWRADDDPRRTYAEADQQIFSLARSATSKSLRQKLHEVRVAS